MNRSLAFGLRWTARLALLVALAGGLLLESTDPLSMVLFAGYGLVAAVLVIRRPRNAVSWILLATAFTLISPQRIHVPDYEAVAAGSASWSDFLIVWSAAWWPLVGFVGFLLLSLVFPSGHLPRGRSRGAAIALVGLAAGAVVLSGFNRALSVNTDGVSTVSLSNRLAVLPDLPLWSILTPEVLILLTIGSLLVGIAWLVIRFRRATGIERRQLRWLTAALAFTAVAEVFGLAMVAVGIDAWLLAIVAFLTIPIAVGVVELQLDDAFARFGDRLGSPSSSPR